MGTTYIVLGTIFLFIIWIANAIMEGWSEAMYFHYKYQKGTEKIKAIEHELWTAQRAVLAIMITIFLVHFFGWSGLFGGLALMSCFPFFHDGMYYHMRNHFDGCYPKGWKDASTTTTAKFSVDFKTRLVLLVVHTSMLIGAMIGI